VTYDECNVAHTECYETYYEFKEKAMRKSYSITNLPNRLYIQAETAEMSVTKMSTIVSS